MNNNSNIFRPPSCHKVQTPQFAKEQQQPKNAKGNNRQVFRIQTFKLSPNFKNNLSQMPSTQDTLEQRLADQTSEIKLLQNQIAELKKQNELLEQRLRKANSTVSDYWIRVKDIIELMLIFYFQQSMVYSVNQFIQTIFIFMFENKEIMFKQKNIQQSFIILKNFLETIHKLNFSRYQINFEAAETRKKCIREELLMLQITFMVDTRMLNNAPFLQLEELRQILLQLGMHESIVQEMQYLNQQAQNQLNVNIDNMTYEQILNLLWSHKIISVFFLKKIKINCSIFTENFNNFFL